MMKVSIREKTFNPFHEIESYEKNLRVTGKYGATAMFVGSMRDFNEGRKIDSMFLEYYPEMTEKRLYEILNDAKKKFTLLDLLLLHRVGEIEVGDHIVLIATWSEHRKEAFDSCRFIMEELKTRAPFWKKEKTSMGDHWVKKNTPGF